SSGSADRQHPPGAHETQHVPRIQLIFILYIVFIPCPVTRRAGADIAALLIPCAWYTSGNTLYARKSDHNETAIR
ncbi:hypothetical protein, partial [Enterobacter roggenkampii]|uniref:hypothetical protein n=1 Tax=Enterobacter roggenkampii TaxID=1812935 RepID=UPI002074C314